MSNSNTPNEPERNPACLRPSDADLASCDCPVCVCRESRRAEAAARAPETAAQYCAREQAEIFAARRARADDATAAEYILREVAEALARDNARRLRAISYDRCHVYQPDIPSDRRDYHADAAAIREIVVSCVVECLAALHPRQRREWFRETIDAHRIARESCPHPDKDLAAAREAFARAGRYADNSDKAIRAATEGFRKDTDAGPAGAD